MVTKRFFIDIDNEDLLKQKQLFVINQRLEQVNFKNKKIISFVGKLNSAKGYIW